ncbi:conjugal transfer protein TrbE [Escherichia coli]|uniref:conjugal transfer protein TrbE n=1 Tax=Escherichia coli TaxID=562 RepID=UPI00112FA160|nr:conjugal transfer protein TrbE [Escherichia coli]HDS2791669.1 conjugal transfer protein TrbE [Escherichia coli]
MKVIFTSNRFIDFLIRLLITAIVISPVIIWSWDTVNETTSGEILAAFVIFYSGVLLFILYFCFSALTDLQKPDDERKSDERNEDE